MASDGVDEGNVEQSDDTSNKRRVTVGSNIVQEEASDASNSDQNLRQELAERYNTTPDRVKVENGELVIDRTANVSDTAQNPTLDASDIDFQDMGDQPRMKRTRAPTPDAVDGKNEGVRESLTSGGFLGSDQEGILQKAAGNFNQGVRTVTGPLGGAVDTVVRPVTGESGETVAGGFTEEGLTAIANVGNVPAWALAGEDAAEFAGGAVKEIGEGDAGDVVETTGRLAGEKAASGFQFAKQNPGEATGILLGSFIGGKGVNIAGRAAASNAGRLGSAAARKARLRDLAADESAQLKLVGKQKGRTTGEGRGKSKQRGGNDGLPDQVSGTRPDVGEGSRLPDGPGSRDVDTTTGTVSGRGGTSNRRGSKTISEDSKPGDPTGKPEPPDGFGDGSTASGANTATNPTLGVPSSLTGVLSAAKGGGQTPKTGQDTVGGKQDTQPPDTTPENTDNAPSDATTPGGGVDQQVPDTTPGDQTPETDPDGDTDTTPDQEPPSTKPEDDMDTTPGSNIDPNSDDTSPVPPWARERPDNPSDVGTGTPIPKGNAKRAETAALAEVQERRAQAQRREVDFGTPGQLPRPDQTGTEASISAGEMPKPDKDQAQASLSAGRTDATDLVKEAEKATLSEGTGTVPGAGTRTSLDAKPVEITTGKQDQEILQTPKQKTPQDQTPDQIQTPVPETPTPTPTQTGIPDRPDRPKRTPKPKPNLPELDTDLDREAKKKRNGASDVFENPVVTPGEALDFDPFG